MITDDQLIIMFGFRLLLSCLLFYIAWFKPALLRMYLYWNSKIFGGTRRGREWMTSKYYFWIMRLVATSLLIMSLVTMVIILYSYFE